MNGSTATPRAKLWLEGFHAFGRHWREWLKPAAGFFAVIAVLWFFMLNDLQGPLQALPKELPTDPQERMKLLKPVLVPFFSWFAVIESVLFIQHYFYLVFFSRRELKLGTPVLSIGRFFYTLAKVIQVMLIIVAVCFAFAGVFAAVGFIPGIGKNFGNSLSLFIAAVMLMVIYYLMIKFSLVSVFAVNKVRPVLKSSWNVTRYNGWRLLWNLFVMIFWMMLISFVVAIISGLAARVLAAAFHMSVEMTRNPIGDAVRASLQQTIFMGVFASYSCAIARILVEEKRQSDPSFSLTTPAN